MTDTIGTIDVEALDAAIAAASPELTEQDRALVRTTYAELGAGRARTPEELAALAGTDPGRAAERFDGWPGVFRDDDGRVVGFWGLAIPAMPHRLAFDDGAEVHAWCAWDPLFLAPIVGRATVTTADPVSGATITYRVGPGGVDADEGQVVSFLQPADTWDEDILGTFCHHVLHFESAATGERWVADHPGTFLLSLGDAVELGRRHAARLVGD